MYDSALVIGDVTVGKATWIGPNFVLDGSGGLSIGSTCTFSAGVQLYRHDTIERAVSEGKTGYRRAATKISDAVFIGPNAVVVAGVDKSCGASSSARMAP
jgi:acetyltransferase-like isoleucine patch superfamily enzyme